jgi:hypothetical protein
MPGADRPNSRERRALDYFCGEPEPANAFSKVGAVTFASLVAKGWVRELPDHPDSSGEIWYEITEEGEAALRR